MGLGVRLLCVVLCGSPLVVMAQNGEDIAARELFDEANARIEEDRFAEARDLYRRSLALRPHPATAFNLANALRSTGELLESERVLDELIDDRYGALDEAQREEARRIREGVRGDVARIRVRACGADASEITIAIDDREVATVAHCEWASVRLDPGEHVIRVRAAETLDASSRVELRAGHQLDEELTLVARPDGVPEARPLRRNPWLWVGIVGALAAGAVGLGLGLRDDTAPLVTDDVFGVTRTLVTR